MARSGFVMAVRAVNSTLRIITVSLKCGEEWQRLSGWRWLGLSKVTFPLHSCPGGCLSPARQNFVRNW